MPPKTDQRNDLVLRITSTIGTSTVEILNLCLSMGLELSILVTFVLFVVVLFLAYLCMKDQYVDHRKQMRVREALSRGPEKLLADRPVPSTPLPGIQRYNLFANFTSRTLTALSEDVLEFRFDGKMKIGGYISLGAGLFVLYPLLTLAWDNIVQSIWILSIHLVGGMAFSLTGLYILLNLGAVRFDRRLGHMTVRRLFGRRDLELARIRGVQLISAGWHTSDGDDFESFQLNLLLDDGKARHPLLEQTEAAPLRGDGASLASFLNVPFLDQLPATSKSAPAASQEVPVSY